MSWASRRRATYLGSILGALALIIGVPLVMWLYEPANCFDGELNQGEVSIDRGGPCKLLDERTLIPHSSLWSRAFSVRSGSYNAVAYIENPNQSAGVVVAPYRFKLYDDESVLVAEREGATFLMPGAITPIFESQIQTGNRIPSRTFFEFAGPLVWERLTDRSKDISVQNKQVFDTESRPRVTARIQNRSVRDMADVLLVAVVFDISGNAFAASSTVIPLLPGDETQSVTFTWPEAFDRRVARVDVMPAIAPID